MSDRFISSEEKRALASYEKDCQRRGTVQNDQGRTEWVKGWLEAVEDHRIAGVEAQSADLRPDPAHRAQFQNRDPDRDMDR